MRVKVLKPWTIEGYTYKRIGEILEVEDRIAMKGIIEGYCVDEKNKMSEILKRADIEYHQTSEKITIKKGKK